MTDILSAAPSAAFTLVSFLVMVSVIVTIHEFGHYISARCFGLIGTHFSLGFGPPLLARKDRHGTEWRISPILLGGYVRFPGEDQTPAGEGQKTLECLPTWQRSIVVAAGPVINLIFAAVLFIAIAYSYGYPTGRSIVASIKAPSPAATAGLQAGDQFTSFDGHKVMTATEVNNLVRLMPDKKVGIDYLRDGTSHHADVQLSSYTYEDDIAGSTRFGYLGASMPTVMKRAADFPTAVQQGISDGLFTVYAQYAAISQIITGTRAITEISGPVRIARMSSHTLSMGLMPFLYLMALFSIAVGIMNLLPIPGLDGGHLATYAVEALVGRQMPLAIAKRMLQFGALIVLAIGLFGLTLDYIALN